MAIKQVKSYIKIQIPAGKANPSPPIGPALGQHGVAIMDFCKQFNEKTKDLEVGLVVPVIISVFQDKSFSFVIKTPPASTLIKKVIGITKGSARPNADKVGSINRKQLEEVANKKMADLSAANIDAAVNTIAGTARSMGINIDI